jgi:hypothetical protein
MFLTLASAYGQKDSYSTYTHPHRTFTLQYPNDWEITKEQDGKVLFARNVDISKVTGESFRVGTFGPTISVTIKQPMYPDQTSIEVCDLFTNFLENTGYTAHNEEITLPNVSDKTCMVQFNTKGERIEAMHGEGNNHPGMVVVIRHRGLLYIIGYETTVDYYFNKYLPVMEQVINSFRILP